MKVVINTCYGGFSLSKEAQELYAEKKGITDLGKYTESYESYENVWSWNINRDDPDLVAVVESLGDAASHRYGKLKVVDIPDDVEWTIMEYDGNEWVAEAHRTWS